MRSGLTTGSDDNRPAAAEGRNFLLAQRHEGTKGPGWRRLRCLLEWAAWISRYAESLWLSVFVRTQLRPAHVVRLDRHDPALELLGQAFDAAGEAFQGFDQGGIDPGRSGLRLDL